MLPAGWSTRRVPFTLPDVKPLTGEERRDARTVEIALAWLLGVVIVVVSTVGFWVVRWRFGLAGPHWDDAATAVFVIASAVGALVIVWRLVRARGRGL